MNHFHFLGILLKDNTIQYQKTDVVNVIKFDEHKKAHTYFQLLGKQKDTDERFFLIEISIFEP